MVRAFKPIDRKALDERLIAVEKECPGMRLGVTETDPDTSFSAFASHSHHDAVTGAKSRLLRTVTGK